ncbi:cobyrinate a,c-diamide synthase [Sneathiella glossodoripedis]|uniref:cobyrinate a,c-diamide synthase n=1 Tax=Sneathiella glossodoripedis TaxID=418853 RepID=UPI000472B210|nr:cobyrinate a,c-diamide synthase [Sneathiella glossodoripedis]
MSRGSAPTLLIAAPATNSGKTTLTLALLRALKDKGLSVKSFKTGPDYIDPVFHHKASGKPCVNIDPWGMETNTRNHLLSSCQNDADIVIGEGVMGLFDGARDGSGSTADLAAEFNIPIILVVSATGLSSSAAALLQGFQNFRDDISIAGVIFNGVGSSNHGEILRTASSVAGIPCVGLISKHEDLNIPRRHLGLVQADENSSLERFLSKAAQIISQSIDLTALTTLAKKPQKLLQEAPTPPIISGQHIAIAEDNAFRFTYAHYKKAWREAGIHVSPFSPLANEAPHPNADFIYLPGGYPELHLPKLSSAENFLKGIRDAKDKSVSIYGECGGYMVMGEAIVGKDGKTYPMAGVLPLKTSFETPKLHLGYRQAKLRHSTSLGAAGCRFRAHEFHYASEVQKSSYATPLFTATDALSNNLGEFGLIAGSAFGSFIHLIDRAQ